VEETPVWARSRATGPVHPRARGQDIRGPGYDQDITGSPTRTWTRQFSDRLRAVVGRIIPTNGEEMRCVPLSTTSPPDHPRARGRDIGIVPTPGHGSGSPTRAWTRRKTWQTTQEGVGFTHACVDETLVPRRLIPHKSSSLLLGYQHERITVAAVSASHSRRRAAVRSRCLSLP
jgi:hypothetical protein